jgi:hypothetical protein
MFSLSFYIQFQFVFYSGYGYEIIFICFKNLICEIWQWFLMVLNSRFVHFRFFVCIVYTFSQKVSKGLKDTLKNKFAYIDRPYMTLYILRSQR